MLRLLQRLRTKSVEESNTRKRGRVCRWVRWGSGRRRPHASPTWPPHLSLVNHTCRQILALISLKPGVASQLRWRLLHGVSHATMQNTVIYWADSSRNPRIELWSRKKNARKLVLSCRRNNYSETRLKRSKSQSKFCASKIRDPSCPFTSAISQSCSSVNKNWNTYESKPESAKWKKTLSNSSHPWNRTHSSPNAQSKADH